MPRKPAHQVTYTAPDGRRLTAAIELRPQGVWAINLTKFNAGRPILKRATDGQGTANQSEAEDLARLVLRRRLEPDTSTGTVVPKTLRQRVREYLELKKNNRELAPKQLARVEGDVFICIGILTELGIHVDQFSRRHVQDLVLKLFERKKPNGAAVTAPTVRRICMSFSGFLSNEESSERIDRNPLRRHPAVPKLNRRSNREWLEPWEACAILDAALGCDFRKNPYFPWMLAVLVYTGMRLQEMYGLMVADVVWGRGKTRGWIWVTDHEHRDLKNMPSRRKVPLWHPLEVLLKGYLARFTPPETGLLFPKPGVEQKPGEALKDAMWRSMRGAMRTVVKAARIKKHVTPHVLRHTYCSTRLQMYVVSNDGVHRSVDREKLKVELGHGSDQMIRDIYAHVQEQSFSYAELDYTKARRQPAAA